MNIKYRASVYYTFCQSVFLLNLLRSLPKVLVASSSTKAILERFEGF